MELQPPDAPLPPLLAALRRRDPDVDIVVLPGQEEPTPATPVDDATVRETAARVTDAATALGAEPPAVATVGYGSDPGTVVARTRLASRRDDGLDALDRLRALLDAGGWQVATPASGLARVTGRRDDLHLQASYAGETGTFLLEISSDPLYVGTDLARELVRG